MHRTRKAIGILVASGLLATGSLFAAEPALVRVLFATPGQVTYLQDGQQIVLHERDSIPPGGEIRAEAGTAVLQLFNGTIVHVRPGSGLVIQPPASRQAVPDKLITRSGRILYQTRSNENAGSVTVQAGGMQVTSGDAVFAASADENLDARLGVHKGGVAVLGARGDQLQAEEGDGVLALAQADSLRKVRLPATPIAQQPKGEQGQKFMLRWSQVPKVSRYRVSIARDKRMADVVFSGTVSDRLVISFDMFVPGSYYWTVESIDGLGFASIPSAVATFVVVARD